MMRTSPFLIRAVCVVAMGGLGFVISCSDEEPKFSREAAYATEESNIDAYYADADDMAGVAVAESDETEGGKGSPGARTQEIKDDRFCNGISISLTNILLPIGDITIDFGDGCTDDNQNTRKGKIKIHFEGRKFRPGSSISISFEDYQINGITLNGTRTLTNLPGSTVNEPKFQIELQNGSAEWDGKTATRENCFEVTWNRGIILAPGDDRVSISQCADAAVAAEGINRNGIHYKVFIDEPLVYKRGCPMAISGIKTLKEVDTGKEIIIDYGSGTCDASITLTVNGNIHHVR